MADEKKSFVLYCDYREHLALLSDSDRGQLLMAIFDYQNDGVIPELPPAAQMAFSFIKAQLDKDASKYAETVRQRSESGKKSAAAKKESKQGTANSNEVQQTLTSGNEVQQSSTNSNKSQQTPTNSTDNVNDNDNVNDIIPPPPQGGDAGGGKVEARKSFEVFWNAYPKKTAKPQALKAWQKLRLNAELIGVILSSLEQQKQSVQWTKDGGQFIPSPANWLNGRRWEDKLPEHPPNSSDKSSGFGNQSSFDVDEVMECVIQSYQDK